MRLSADRSSSVALTVILTLLACVSAPGHAGAAGSSLRFHGNGTDDIDRVKVPIENPARPVDVGATDLTIEWWMKAFVSENASGNCSPGGDNWISGNIMFDRDVFGSGDYGDWGISLASGRIAFGVNNGTDGTTICGATNVADGVWHHIAVTRRSSDGLLRVFVDGVLDAGGDGPNGDVSYRDGRATTFPNDPFLVIGAEKHDAGAAFPSYSGWIDEVRVSTVLRYQGTFTRPSAPFSNDASTVALYHFDEGSGDVIADSSGAAGGPSDGTRKFGGSPAGPEWSTNVPLFGAPVLALEPIATGLASPVAITHAGDGSSRLFITQQTGQILAYDGTQLRTFLDIAALVKCCGEEGLLSVAFHPSYTSNGFFYVYYTNLSGNNVVARYTVSGDPNAADPASGVVVLTIPHPGAANHNGGQLQFGPDSYLSIGVGDGGGAGDPSNNAQNLGTLLGKLLRIDVDGGFPYTIPSTNPFVETPVDNPATRGEIWAWGLRNPWRFSFDRVTGDLILGDVGQDSREEVDLQPATSPGGENYGWRRMEGTACFIPSSGCNDGTLTLPILEYDHSGGNCSITGGYRYRGTQIPQLQGIYLYADFCAGRVWGASQDPTGSWSATQLLDTALLISTFGEDGAGELYLAHLSGIVYRIVAVVPFVDATPPALTFGSIPVGGVSPLQTIAVQNNGAGNVGIGTLSLGGTNPTQFLKPAAQDLCSGMTLAPGQVCTVGVQFAPTTVGSNSASLVIPSTDPDDNPVTVPLSGTGAGGPDITVSPLSLAFGDVRIGSTSLPQAVVVKNDGTTKLPLGPITLGGTDPSEFRKKDRCSKKTLKPGQSCTVDLRFRPTSTGAKSATLSIPSTDPDENPVTVTITGTGTP